MNWLQDKKNQPFVITIAIVLLLGAGGLFAWQNGMFTAPVPAASAPVAQTVPTTPSVETPAPPPPAPPVKAAAPPTDKAAAKPGAAATAAAAGGDPTAILVGTGPDPFHLPGTPATSKLKDQPPPPPTPLPQIPDPLLARWHDLPVSSGQVANVGHPVITTAMADTSGRRMSGVLFGNGVYALLEANGKTEAVQPGDTVDGGTVVSIDATSLTLKTDNNKLVTVSLSGGNDQ
jgi:hypothetical protein